MAKSKSGGNPRTVPEGKTQVNFNINADLLEQVKDIAFWERVSNAELYNKAVQKFVALYIKKNGKIKPRPKTSGLDNL